MIEWLSSDHVWPWLGLIVVLIAIRASGLFGGYEELEPERPTFKDELLEALGPATCYRLGQLGNEMENLLMRRDRCYSRTSFIMSAMRRAAWDRDPAAGLPERTLFCRGPHEYVPFHPYSHRSTS